MAEDRSAAAGYRVAEVICSLSLAADLATGQPMEHSLRRALLAVWLGEGLGVEEATLRDVYYVALLGSVGCALEAAEFSNYFPDEITLGGELGQVDPTRRMAMAGFILSRAGAGETPLRRARKVLSVALEGPAQSAIVCRDVAMRMGEMLNMGAAVREAIGQCHEQWSGKGWPRGLRGEQIHPASRLYILAHDMELSSRRGGAAAAIAIARHRSGSQYDPRFARHFCDVGDQLIGRLNSISAWDEVLAVEPRPVETASEARLDEMLDTIGAFVDSRSRYTLGHSRAVAHLAQAAARSLGMSESEALTVRHAGQLHDLGRTSVPVALWDKAGALTEEDVERMKRHPSMTEVVLARSNVLGHLGTLAGLHHERLDGSGYRGVTASFLPLAARILAAADAFQTKLEPRPHRAAQTPEEAAKDMRRDATDGKLDGEAVAAVIDAAGWKRAGPRREYPAGLSEREVEVLRLAVQGLSNRETGEALYISPRTVGHHIEHIYDKIGVSTRVGAALFAQQHHLI